jgi:hypothetical protein
MGWLDVVLNMALSTVTQAIERSRLRHTHRTTHQSRLSCTLNTVQSEEEWRGIRAFFLMIVMMCLDFVENEGYAVLRLVVNYLDGHCSVSVQVST